MDWKIDNWQIFSAILVLIFLLIPVFCFAADITLKWDAVEGATSYKIQMSTDLGLTWVEERDAGSEITLIWTGAPDSGLVFFRAVACNNVADTIRTWSGAFYNGDWKAPDSPAGTGIE